MSSASSDKKGQKRTGLFCAGIGLINKYPWIKALTKLKMKDRRFYDPMQEGQKWVIQLCSAFEERRARESAKIPSDVCGIYRYVRENGEVVYIGRGNIKNVFPLQKDVIGILMLLSIQLLKIPINR